MAEPIDLGDDDGTVSITLGGVTLEVDLWQVSAKIAGFHKANKDKSDEEYNGGLARLVEALGFGPVSHRMGQRFVEAVNARVKQLAGKSSGPAASAGSTGSTPAAGPRES